MANNASPKGAAMANNASPKGAAMTDNASPKGAAMTDKASKPPAMSDSVFFSTAAVEERNTVHTDSDGDLWASCWADDDHLYSANGDGHGFPPFPPRPGIPDIVVNRIEGRPPHLTGVTLALGDEVGSIWTPGGHYNRKPTGMACVKGALYLAIQDLNRDFNDAPAASISKSTDHGRTWQWDRSAPMFDDYKFTTLMFLDYGRNNEHAPNGEVYVYGLDGNWRDSFNNRVPDPTALFLAKVPANGIQDRSQWRFFSGLDGKGRPTWSPDLSERKPVLQTARRVYEKVFAPVVHNMSVISQGSVVYNKPLKRYLYTSWTEFTFEFYEAPAPWGPWRLFLSKDFGGYPWTPQQYGGYAATIPSKFISPDGKTMWVQSDTFAGGVKDYRFSLRKLAVQPRVRTRASNPKDRRANLAMTGRGTTPLSKSSHYGHLHYLNDGRKDRSEDDWDQEDKPLSWWGYGWDRNYRMNRLLYTTGKIFHDGGGFGEVPRVEVRNGARWVPVKNLRVTPEFPAGETVGEYRTYAFEFDPVTGDGIRLIGAPGGKRTFTSISELEVYYAENPESGKGK
ncbi:MAG: DUF4185 domain-containing protein [Armatimonadetes bacterium]|nr:DUF4185 domain-containing protein [Armatimonadota bacterium]